MLSVRIVKRWLAGPVLLLFMVLAGCVNTLRHDVTVFHDWPATQPERSYRFAVQPEHADSLEFKTYQRVIAQELARKGFAASETPNLTISFDYVNKSRIVRYIDSGPVYPSYFGLGVGGRRSSLYFSAPFVWGWPHHQYEHQVEHAQRVLTLGISQISADSEKKIYEATASSSGREPAMAAALPLLMRAVLADFPGRSGLAREVDVSLDEPRPTPETSSSAPLRPK